MGKKTAVKTLRPSGSPAAADPRLAKSIDDANADLAAAALRPEAAGGEANLAGADLSGVGREYVGFMEELAELEDKADRLKAKMKHREEWMLEAMRSAGVPRFTVAGVSGARKTFSVAEDWIVSKAKGIDTEYLAGVLREIDLPELIGQAVNANTLKATVKQFMATAGLAESMGERGYCRNCSTFFPVASAGLPCEQCTAAGELLPVRLISKVIDGIPAELRAILYVEKQYKLGARSA